MTDKKNNLGFGAKIEYSKNRPFVLLPDGESTTISLATGPLGGIFGEPADVDGTPNILFTPLDLQGPEAFQNALKTSDLIFCERPDFFVDSEDCPTCIPNPLGFVPDWRSLDPDEYFFDPRRCKYSIVINTVTTQIPTDPQEIQSYKLVGLRSLLRAYQKSEITTTVYYLIDGQTESEIPDPSTLTDSDIYNNAVYLQAADLQNVGAPVSSLLNGEAESVDLPDRKKGFIRLLQESDTSLTLLETLTKTGEEAVTIEYYNFPTSNSILTKALISVDAEIFRRIPALAVTQPDIEDEFQDNGGIVQTVIRGEEFRKIFRDVSRSLKRANKYATNAIKGVEQNRFYYRFGSQEVPVIFDFEEESRQLTRFNKDFLTPAIEAALGVRIRDVEKVRISIEKQENNTLKIVEVTANSYGCEEVNFSQLRMITEIDLLFKYSRTTTLGYVSALPDMLFYIEGIVPIVWVEFITRFTYPEVVLRTPLDLVSLDDDRTAGECAAQKTQATIVNDILNEVLGVPDLLLDELTESICKTAADIVAEKQILEETVAQRKRKNVKVIKKEIKRLEKSISEQEETIADAEAGIIDITDQEYNAMRQKLDSDKTQLVEQKSSLKDTKADIKSIRGQARGQANEERRNKFLNSLAEKIEEQNKTNLASKPLAKVLTTSLLFGIEEGLKEKEDRGQAKLKNKIYDLEEVQRSMDNILGGYCGFARLIVEATQCLLRGAGLDDLKNTLIKSAFKTIPPRALRNFLRELGIRDPARMAQFDQRFRDFTGKSLDSVLSAFSDATETDTYNYAENYESKRQEILDSDLTEYEESDKKTKKISRTSVTLEDGSEGSYWTVTEIKEGRGDSLTSKTLYQGTDSREVSKQINPNVRQTVNQERKRQIEINGPVGELDEAIELATALLPPAFGEASVLLTGQIKNFGELSELVLSFLGELFSVDELFDFLGETVPGLKLVEFIKDLECVIPKLPDLNPSLGLNLKSFNIDICQLSVSGKPDLTLPKFNPPLDLRSQKVFTDIKNIFNLLADYLLDMLIDIGAQLIIKALTTIIEAVLDLACDLLATTGAAIRDAINGNSKFREQLKEAICPAENLTDRQFAEAMTNVFGALSNSKAGQSCVENLSPSEMADFIDSVLVSTSYNELFNLMLGQANENTYVIISNIAANSRSECIKEIFGNTDNVFDYFRGLGALIGAEDIFDSIPSNLYLQDGANVCPPDQQDYVRQLQAELYRNKGLTPDQVNQQLDFLKEQAQKKLEELASLLREGPYADLPSLLASGECPDNGLLRSDPAAIAAINVGTDAVLESLRDKLIIDLIGNRGVLPTILSDSEGNGLRLHRFLTNGIFGNPIGKKNFLYQFYSDDSMVYNELDLNIKGELSVQDGQGAKRVFQSGQKYPSAPSLIQPVGGFPPTVGAYLYDKLKKSRIGLLEQGNNQINQKLEFSTRLLDLDLVAESDRLIVENQKIINLRKQYIAKWAAATHFVDYATLEDELVELESDGSIIIDEESGETIPLLKFSESIRILSEEPREWKNPSIEKRREIYRGLINACSEDIISSGINYRQYSPQQRLKRLLTSTSKDNKNLNINGRIVGISLADFRDRINKLKKFKDLTGNQVETYSNINLARKFSLTQEIRQLYLEIAQETLETELSQIVRPNPYELAMEFVPYKERKVFDGGAFGLDEPDIKIVLTYNLNPQTEDGEFLQDKFVYIASLTQEFNPFGSTKAPSNREQLEEVYDSTGKQASEAINTSFAPLLPEPVGKEDPIYVRAISSVPSQEVKDYVNEFIGSFTPASVTYSYETEFLRTWLNSNIVNLPITFTGREVTPSEDPVVDFFDHVNQGFFRRISRRIAEPYDGVINTVEFRKPRDSDPVGYSISKGFLFGYDPFKQPESFVLDPAKYGGTEANPPFYLQPPEYDGWLGLLQKLIPQEEGCQPEVIPLYDMEDILLSSQQMFSQLKVDKRLNFTPLCTKEAPYNSIRDRAAIVGMENVIRVTTRVHIIDFFLKAVPVFSQFSLNLEGNFDALIESYLSEYVLDRVREQGTTRPTRKILTENKRIFVTGEVVPTNKYYFNFLEAAVSNVLHKIESGIIKEEDLNPDQAAAIVSIRKTISDYETQYSGTEAVLSEESIQAQNLIKRSVNPVINNESNLGRNSAKFDRNRARRIKVGLLYQTIRETQEVAKTVFSLYIKSEFEALRERLNDALKPSVDDLGLLFLSDPIFMNGHARKRSFERGVAYPNSQISEEQEQNPVYVTRPDGTIEYEVPFNVPSIQDGVLVSDVEVSNAFESSVTTNLITPGLEGYRDWPFVLEKYIRIEEKEDLAGIPAEIVNRDQNLRGIIKISDWIEYLNNLPEELRQGRISDFFGSWTFGLRLSAVIGEQQYPLATTIKELGLLGDGQEVFLGSSDSDVKRIIIPIASGELEIVDQIISETVQKTDIVGNVKEFELERQYDTVCLINEMIKTVEYKTFFEYVFPFKRYLSLLTVYVSNVFYLSIGNTGDATPEQSGIAAGDRWAQPGGRNVSTFKSWNKNDGNFRRSKRMLKSMFMDFYNTLNKDVTPRSRNNDGRPDEDNFRDLLTQLIPDNFLNGTPWWQRRMRVNKPFDMFDGECQDEEDYF